MVQVTLLAAATLDMQNLRLMKHSLYRMSSSAAANNGIPQYGWGCSPNQLQNILVDIAAISLMSCQHLAATHHTYADSLQSTKLP